MATTKKTKSIAGTKRKQSPLQKALNTLKKTKSRNCDGKATTAQVRKAADTYIARAMKKGQTKAEATRKANAITTRKCAK